MPKTPRGRPTIPDARCDRLRIRLTKSEKAAVQRVAAQNRQTMSEFCREAIAEAAADCSEEPLLRAAG